MYAAAQRSSKGNVAEIVMSEIAALGGKFLEPQADNTFVQVNKKRAIEKTCQALREKKNNLPPGGRGVQRRPSQVSPDQEHQVGGTPPNFHHQHQAQNQTNTVLNTSVPDPCTQTMMVDNKVPAAPNIMLNQAATAENDDLVLTIM